MRQLTLIGFLVASTGPALAADYYVSDCQPGADAQCVAGDDANAGTSLAAPWRTYDRANTGFKASAFSGGDRILFARGGSFAASRMDWTNSSCLGDPSPCVIGAYTPPWASGDEGRPILTNLTNDLFRFANGGNSEVDGNYELRGLELRGGGVGTGIYIYNDVDDLLMEDLVVDGFQNGIYVGPAAATLLSPSDGACDRVTLRNSRIVNNNTQGLIGSGDDLVIEGNFFDNNGFANDILNHHIYLAGSGEKEGTDPSQNLRISGNELYRSSIFGGQCAGAPISIHGWKEGLVVENNLIREDVGAAAAGCWGIAVNAAYEGEAEGVPGLVVRGNTIVNVGNNAIHVSECPDCLVENNVIIQEQTAFNTTAITASKGTTDDPLDMSNDNVTIRNNSVYFGPGVPGGIGITIRDQGTSHVVMGNAVHYAGTSASWNCLELNLPAASHERVDNNICHAPSALSSEWENGSGSLAAWRAATGFDVNSSTANPQFVSPASPDLNLALSPGSPAVGLADPALSPTIDILGNARDGAPDAGAYELAGPADFLPPARPRNLRLR